MNQEPSEAGDAGDLRGSIRELSELEADSELRLIVFRNVRNRFRELGAY